MKKFLAVLMALVLCVSMLPGMTLTASAEVTYKLEGSTLTISGSGTVGKDYQENKNITTVIIENGITEIGSKAFYYCTNLESVSLPSSVTSIGSNAFAFCSSLTSVSLPGSVGSIANGAFYGCSSLSTVIYSGTSEPTAASNAFAGTGVFAVSVPADYTGEYFCGKMVVKDKVKCAECQVEVDSADTHKASCGHYTCVSGYVAAAHAKCDACNAYLCGGDHSNCVVTYTVTCNEATNGSVSADKTSGVKQGETVTLTITPVANYELATLTVKQGDTPVDVSDTGNTRTFTMPAENVTVTATFKGCTYNINYNLDGGQINDSNYPTTYTYGVGATLPTDVTRAGFTFLGWYTSTSTSPMSSIGTGAAGHKTYYARWEAVDVPVITVNQYIPNDQITTQGKIIERLNCVANVSDNSTLSYQWYQCDDANGTNYRAIAGATGSGFEIPKNLTAGNYYYYCVVSAQGAVSVASRVSTVTVKLAHNLTYAAEPDVGGTVSGAVGSDNNVLSAIEGTTIRLTATPATGYHLKSLKVTKADGSEVTVTNNSFTMPAENVTVTATFKADHVCTLVKVDAVAATCSAGGNIEHYKCFNTSCGKLYEDAAGTKETTAEKVVTGIDENAHVWGPPIYPYKDAVGHTAIYVCQNDTSHTRQYNSPHDYDEMTHVCVCGVKEVFTVTADGILNGSVEVDKATANMDDTITLTVKPASGYELKSIEAVAGDVPVDLKKSGSAYTFTMPAANVTVRAEFVKMVYDVSVTCGSGAIVMIDGQPYGGSFTVEVEHGDDLVMEVKTSVGCYVRRVVAENEDGLTYSGRTVKLENVSADNEITIHTSRLNIIVPTTAPTEEPTEAPTEAPTEEPTEAPTEEPTEEPTEAPTEEPTEAPTEEPTEEPTEAPTEKPTEEPTEAPTEAPTEEPTEAPTEAPTEEPTELPTQEPVEDDEKDAQDKDDQDEDQDDSVPKTRDNSLRNSLFVMAAMMLASITLAACRKSRKN